MCGHSPEAGPWLISRFFSTSHPLNSIIALGDLLKLGAYVVRSSSYVILQPCSTTDFFNNVFPNCNHIICTVICLRSVSPTRFSVPGARLLPVFVIVTFSTPRTLPGAQERCQVGHMNKHMLLVGLASPSGVPLTAPPACQQALGPRACPRQTLGGVEGHGACLR